MTSLFCDFDFTELLVTMHNSGFDDTITDMTYLFDQIRDFNEVKFRSNMFVLYCSLLQ